MRLDLIPVEKQNVWKWPAAANFVLSGAGSGLYLLSYFLLKTIQGTTTRELSAFTEITSVTLVIMGFACVSIELGRLSSARNTLRRLSSSWISREVLFGVIFLASVLLNLGFGYKYLSTVAALSAAGILVSQGFILNTARSVTAWNLRIIPVFIFVSGLHSGYGLSLLIRPDFTAGTGIYMAVGVFINIMNLIIWAIYAKSGATDFKYAARSLKSNKFRIVTIGIGHIGPIILITLCILIWYHRNGVGISPVFLFVSGIGMFAGSAIQKIVVVLKAGYKTGIWMPTDL